MASKPASCDTLSVIPLVRLATKKPEFLVRPANGQRSAHANGDAPSRLVQSAKPGVANGDADEPDGISRLSPRQLAAVNLLFKGLSYREISESLGISLFTVRSHLHSAYKRLQVKSRGQAVARILRESSLDLRTLRNGHDVAPPSSAGTARATLTKR